MLANGKSNDMLCSNNEFVNYISEFIIDARKKGYVKDNRRDTEVEGGNG